MYYLHFIPVNFFYRSVGRQFVLVLMWDFPKVNITRNPNNLDCRTTNS